MHSKIIVITGCSKSDGVGYNLSHEMLKRGHKVIATVRNFDTCALDKNTAPNSDNLDIRHLDLCDDASIESFITDIHNDYGYIDVLVHNAANVAIGPIEAISDEDAKTTYQTKVFAPLKLTQGFIPCMRERRSGLITTTGSIFSTMPINALGAGLYVSALIAFERILDSLAIELQPWNINIVNFHPGPISTSLTRFEGSKTDVIETYYKNFTTQAYSWFDEHTEWQGADSVALAYADMIEHDNPDFHTYSSDFGRQFARKFVDDVTGNSYRNDYLEHFKSQHREEGDWTPFSD